MGKLLYCWKIVLLSDHMEKLVNIFSKRSSNKNKRLFVILCVLLCSVVDHGFTHTASAPHNDVQMINDFVCYEGMYSSRISQCCKKSYGFAHVVFNRRANSTWFI